MAFLCFIILEKNEEYIKLFIDKLPQRIDEGRMDSVLSTLTEMHPADIADVLSKVSPKNAVALVRLFEEELRSDVFSELEEHEREKMLEGLSAKEIAETVIEKMDTDDAADLIGELPEDKQEEVKAPDPNNPTGQLSIVQNAGAATISGLEVEVQAQVSDALYIRANAGFLDAEYDDFDTAPCSIFDPNVGDGCTQDLGGKPLQRAPDNQATLIFDYNRPLGGNLALETSLGATYTDEFSVSASDDFYSEDTHSMFARVALLSPGNGWTVAARIDNITDEDAIVTRQPTNLVGELVIGAIQTPRTYSLQLMKELLFQ